jgi:predicted Zn-dependent protease
MTVRWKPLLILSGLFLVIAVVGVIAIVSTLMPRGSADILPAARAERAAKRFENAEIHYRNALQKDGRNAAIHEELAGMYAEWAERAPAEKKADLQALWSRELMEATRFDQKGLKPRRELLADAMRRDDAYWSVYWAKDLLNLEPSNGEAHYVLAAEGIDERTPNLPEITRHLAALESVKAPVARITWVKTRLAQLTSDKGAMEETLSQSRTLVLPADANPVDRMALLRLRALDAEMTTDTEALATRVQALQTEARALVAGPAVATPRISRLSQLLQEVQRSLSQVAGSADPRARTALMTLVDAIDQDVEAIFQKLLSGSSQPEIAIYLTYADHLRFRNHREKCLEVVSQGLNSPLAAKPASAEVVNGLHAIAVESILADAKDPERFTRSSPHITELINSAYPRFQGLGHLFQGAIDLERSGVSGAATSQTGVSTPTAASASQAKLRTSALSHLKIAATQLPGVAETQARYGVALILTQEPGLGRQYLETAMRQGRLDAQYQVWAAWSMVQAGYPEEAEPVVDHLQAQVADGKLSRDLEATLHLLRGEIHQARHSPAELQKAVAEYDKAMAGGKAPSASVQLRLAQIEVQLGQINQALARLDLLRKSGDGGPGAEHLAVLALQEQGKPEEARKTLDQARQKYPESDELVGLDAALWTKAEKPGEADALLAAYLEKHPDNMTIALMRAQVLAEPLNRPKEARKLLVQIAERSENSAPLVQLALLDLKQKDYEAVSATIAKIRNRWKESVAADLLDAQMALDRGDVPTAQGHFSEALKKDPKNKLVQYWKAQLDRRTGSASEAARTFEAIARERPVKEVDDGLSLMSAAQSALANLALENGDIDAAIHRFEDLRRSGEAGALGRADRWQLITAYNARGQWPQAKKELASLLNDAKYPPTNDERVRAANYYRMNNEDAAAQAQLDYVLKVNPANPSAVVTRSYLLANARKTDEAATILRKAIETTQEKEKAKPPAIFYLMLAAVESVAPPADGSARRALGAIDEGLVLQPDSLELVQAKYRLLLITAGEKPALAFIEEKAKAPGSRSSEPFRRMLVEVYREQKQYTAAEEELRKLVAEHPTDAGLAAGLVRLVCLEAVEAADQGDRNREQTLNETASGLIRDFRGKFPGDLAFLQSECELAARRGDLNRAMTITQEMDKIAKNSPAGPLTRAMLYAAQGKTAQVASAYTEALDRNPRQLDVRILLGQSRLKLGEADEALRQARFVLDIDRNQPDAVLLQARALASQSGPDRLVAERRAEALKLLGAAIAKNPRFIEAYHLSSEIQLAISQRDQAIAALKAGVKAVPDDATGLSRLVELLTEPHDGASPKDAELADAAAIAQAAGDRDTKGNVALALAIGFHKAGALQQALPWAQKAVEKLGTPAVHLNFGDLLLSLAEEAKDPAQSRGYLERAVGQYDLVLKSQANSIEAINNKAWILHTYLGESRQALTLARGLADRVDPAVLPGEFFDTLGAIQEALGLSRDAEESFNKGLRKSPNHPVLNYHMGKLIASDPKRSGKAVGYLEKAKAGQGRLSPAMLADVNALMDKIARN